MLLPLPRIVKIEATKKEMLQYCHEVCNNFKATKAKEIELEIMPLKEKVEVCKQEMITEIARFLYYLTCDSSGVRGKMVI
jgi:Zn finger protein HypA/HybF involved in hydrogenase expression